MRTFSAFPPAKLPAWDPQQRLLLEVAWNALEHAGQVPGDLLGTETGVFMGCCRSDYSELDANDLAGGAYRATGNAGSILAGRLSYVLGLRGPSLVVDTACSSSLVAVHLACLRVYAAVSAPWRLLAASTAF